jgi:hypothetical protein
MAGYQRSAWEQGTLIVYQRKIVARPQALILLFLALTFKTKLPGRVVRSRYEILTPPWF